MYRESENGSTLAIICYVVLGVIVALIIGYMCVKCYLTFSAHRNQATELDGVVYSDSLSHVQDWKQLSSTHIVTDVDGVCWGESTQK